MSAYMFGVATMTSGTGVADASALTAGAFWAVQGGTTTQLTFLDEIYLGGQATATAPAIMLLGRDSTVAGTSSASALATPNSFGLTHPSGGVITTVPIAFISCATTQPQRSNSVTLGKKNFSFNLNGGIVRCNYANTNDRFGILGSAASLGEMSLSAFTGTTSGLFGGHMILELQELPLDEIPLVDALPSGVLAVSDEIIERNIKANCARGLPQLDRSPGHKGRAIICAGGPSLRDAIPKIKHSDCVILAINNASRFLIEHGVVPHFIALADPREVLREQFAIDDRCSYLVSSKCDPFVFDALDGKDVMLWHEYNTEPHLGWIKKHYPEPVFSVYGSTTTLRAMGLLYAAGFRRVDFYGWDGSSEGGKHHAYEQNDDAEFYADIPATGEIRVRVNDRVFTTRGDYAREAHEAIEILGHYKAWADSGLAERLQVRIHGDGLIPYFWRQSRHLLA